ncbi:MAG TPA: rod-binding protein [Bryobacteraceae bacterium]|jgi:flagellar protein FlgJ|nr:rod-binding protein [Bryobacteraceae bacterium]
MTSPALLNSAALPAPAQPKPRTTEAAARQFEALLIGEMLRSARESAAEEDDEGGNTKQTMLDVADQQFAQVLANNGGLGMAKMIVKGLEKHANQQ